MNEEREVPITTRNAAKPFHVPPANKMVLIEELADLIELMDVWKKLDETRQDVPPSVRSLEDDGEMTPWVSTLKGTRTMTL